MFCIFGKRAALGCAFLLASCTKHYRAEGVVLRVDPSDQTLVVSHRAIPGYMEGMAMPFHVAAARELDGLTPGARIDFRLNVSRKRSYISRVRRRAIPLDDVALPAESHRVRIGDEVPDFALIDQSGQTVRLSNLRGGLVAIDFIYTRCPMPDVCPRLSANFALVQRRFGARVTLLSVTIDPQYDTPAVLADYARRWGAGASWHFLTGAAKEIQDAAGWFGLIYWPEDGVITHSAATGLIGPDGRLRALLEGSAFTAQQLVDLVQSALRNEN